MDAMTAMKAFERIARKSGIVRPHFLKSFVSFSLLLLVLNLAIRSSVISLFPDDFSIDGSAFRKRSIGWTTPNQTGYSPAETVMVFVTHSDVSTYEALEGTVTDVLVCPHAAVFVYTSSESVLERLRLQFRDSVAKGRLAIHVSLSVLDVNAMGHELVDDMNLAYLLDFAAHHQEQAHFTMVLKAGTRLLLNATDVQPLNFTSTAVQHYQLTLATNRRVCWSMLSDQYNERELPAFMIETAEHAGRMAMTLRSALPYRAARARDIINLYCSRFLWNTAPIAGPRLFEYHAIQLVNETSLESSVRPRVFLNASKFPTPSWIDPNVVVGPVVYGNGTRPYKIVFGCPTMPRPGNVTEYLEKFMTEIVHIIETNFMHAAMNGTDPTYHAALVLLVSGNTLDDIANHRRFLESTYQNVIDRGIVRLVDAPFESYPLHNMHLSYPEDSHERRFWRSKQNLDVSSTLRAMAGMSEYVMLLEDDTGFKDGFANHLKEYLVSSSAEGEQPYGIPRWSVTDYGFGYSGILLHSSDAILYQNLHWTFFDEMPCDLLGFQHLVRNAETTSHTTGYRYFKHYGKISTLAGKSQDVFRRR